MRDQITTETWERLNLIHLRMTDPKAAAAFADGRQAFLHDTIADLHLFKGAADATMSHGEGWRFLLLGVYLERAQLIGAPAGGLLRRRAGGAPITDHSALTSLLRMGCALEPYLRVYTADMQPRFILEFLLLDEDFPRSIRFCTARIEEHLALDQPPRRGRRRDRPRPPGRPPARAAAVRRHRRGRRPAAPAPSWARCSTNAPRIHQAVYETFVAYPLEQRLPAVRTCPCSSRSATSPTTSTTSRCARA